MSKFYKHQWFGRTSEYPNVTEPKDEFYEDIRRVNTKERLAIEKYMMTEYDYQREIPNKPGYDTRMDMNLHPYYAKTCCHHYLEDEPAYHLTNDDTNCDYWNPQESDIVNMKGYNATNIRIMHQVSKRIADLTKLLGLINDLTKPLDLAYIQCKCPAINSSLFRTILSVAFNELLKKDMALATKLQALINPADTPANKDPEPGKADASTSTEDIPSGTSVHRPEYTNYPKISEEFIERILKQIYEEGNWKPTEGKPGHQDENAQVQPPVIPEVKPPKVEDPTPTKPEGTTETTPHITEQPSPTTEHNTVATSETGTRGADASATETTHTETNVSAEPTAEHHTESPVTTTPNPTGETVTATVQPVTDPVTDPVTHTEESH